MQSGGSNKLVLEYTEFFENRLRRSLRLAYVMCGNEQEAEDIVAEAFARMYVPWMQGEIEEPVAYLRRAIANQVNSRWRHKDVERRYDTRVKTLWKSESPAADEAIAARDAVHIAMASLPEKQRMVIALRYLEDLSEAETAAILDLNVGTVKSHASRGLQRLREALAETAETAEG